MNNLKKNGKTILFVTHSIADVIRNCTKTIIIDGGKKIFEGSVKEGTEKYKKLIVGLDINEESDSKSIEEIEKEEELKKSDEIKEKENIPKPKKKPKEVFDNFQVGNDKKWKSYFIENDKLIDYGNKKADVIDYGIFDLDNHPINSIGNDEEVVLKSKIRFNTDIENPIFTMTLKDFKGLDITGTNTDIEKVYTGEFKKGDVVVVEFKQKIPVTPNKYTLSFSCTHFDEKGNLEVLNRKYDALLLEVTSSKNSVGLLRIDSKINVVKL